MTDSQQLPRLIASDSDSSQDSKTAAVPSTKWNTSSTVDGGDDFLGQTVQDLQDALSSIQIWARSRLAKDSDKKARRSISTITIASCNPGWAGRGSNEHSSAASTTTPMKREKDRRSAPKQNDSRRKSVRRSFFGALTSCTCTTDDFSRMRKMVDDVVVDIRMDDDDDDDGATLSHEYGAGSVVGSEEDEEGQQLRRLTSWGTLATQDTLETNQSFGTLISERLLSKAPVAHASLIVDDDGIPINTRIFERTVEASHKRHSTKRKRLVQFDYPPVSSFRECPRLAEADVALMFFSPEELDLYEDDRISTSVADDVEVVAVASSVPTRTTPPVQVIAEPAAAKQQLANTSSFPRTNSLRSPTGMRSPNSMTGSSLFSWTSPTNSNSCPAQHKQRLLRSPMSVSSLRASPTSSSITTTTNNNNNSPARKVLQMVRSPSPVIRTSPIWGKYNNNNNNNNNNSRQHTAKVFTYDHADVLASKNAKRKSPRGDKSSNNNQEEDGTTTTTTTNQAASSPIKDKRLVKSVQIYLRERSTGVRDPDH
jgi:hypothetical protein